MAGLNRELADFLRRARSQVDPSRAGLPSDGRVRRVKGLRREEVALLAGVSADYYARLEQGRRISPRRPSSRPSAAPWNSTRPARTCATSSGCRPARRRTARAACSGCAPACTS
ncbi:helix-turn-helix domain-containing protein [Lentzea guizhouensis]|uniref:helix-turn-helix domain-containing protein n=1 Tax=Lentzea guizhouensis TaxID=1586287 RepID=UPI001F2FA8EC|nr:helix-turn-helix transcriptional regulator [Lentzea guizhouensis]